MRLARHIATVRYQFTRGLIGHATLTRVLELAGRFIALCWVMFFVVWFIAAWFAKRTVERSGTWVWWIVWIGAILLVGTRSGWLPLANRVNLWRATPGLAAVGAAVTAAGLSVALWARAVLGRNWSGAIVMKEHHELIDRGPYAFVRHPIYTGVLLMVLGTVTVWGTRAGVMLFATMVAGFIVKARREERLLTKHFPEVYPRYRARVRARLIPFVL
jgi:protein-S-isoprenylcysteine O-methyltransferase Ste14